VNLSENFTLEEMIRSETASRKGIDNRPDSETIANLTELALALEKVRSVLGRPIHITSGYRSPKVNAAIGSSPSSAHIKGYAADFVVSGLTPREVCERVIASGIDFDQVIKEFDSWTHLSIDPRNRKMALTIDRNGTRVGLA
jgi:zinc D-Ala-D-Ala carboxypeptidase